VPKSAKRSVVHRLFGTGNSKSTPNVDFSETSPDAFIEHLYFFSVNTIRRPSFSNSMAKSAEKKNAKKAESSLV